MPSRATARSALPSARVTLLDLGASARYSAACASANRASGRPTDSSACHAAVATGSAEVSASPTSSLAMMIMRRARNLGSSPAVSIRTSQYIAASGSEPRSALTNALTWS